MWVLFMLLGLLFGFGFFVFPYVLLLFLTFILGFLFPVYLKRRCWRSMWYPQPWYWFISKKFHKRGYTESLSFKILHMMNITI